MPQGTIIRARDDKGFCFILEDAGVEIFAARNQFADTAISFDGIEGTRVDFRIAQTSRGFQAERVVILPDDRGREHGAVDKAIKDYGFILSDADGERIFFHKSGLVGMDWPEHLRGTRVTYTIGVDKKTGRGRALAVRKES